jgi:hypothetical protein
MEASAAQRGNACCSHAVARPRRVQVHRRRAVHAGATREMKSRGESVEKETWEILFTVRVVGVGVQVQWKHSRGTPTREQKLFFLQWE